MVSALLLLVVFVAAAAVAVAPIASYFLFGLLHRQCCHQVFILFLCPFFFVIFY